MQQNAEKITEVNYRLNITYLCVLLSLWFCITNKLLIALTFHFYSILILALLFPLLSKLYKFQFYLLAYLLYSFVGVCLYHMPSIYDFQFYRYDGNLFIVFIPLFLLGNIILNSVDRTKHLKYVSITGTLVCTFIIVYQKYAGLHLTGLFISVNALAGYLTFLIAVNFSFMINSQNKLFWGLIFWVSILCLLLTLSRGSIVAITISICSFLACSKLTFAKHLNAVLIFVILLIQLSVISYTLPIYQLDNFAYETFINDDAPTKMANVILRVFENWPRALNSFLHSPIFGTGLGSLNDFPITLSKDFLFSTNTSSNFQFTSAHGHHTYFHILGEQGLIGLMLFLGFWGSLLKYIKTNICCKPIKDALIVLFWALTFVSFTEHRITSPSNILPFILLTFIGAKTKPGIKET